MLALAGGQLRLGWIAGPSSARWLRSALFLVLLSKTASPSIEIGRALGDLVTLSEQDPALNSQVLNFYKSRSNEPVWLNDGTLTANGKSVITVLQNASRVQDQDRNWTGQGRSTRDLWGASGERGASFPGREEPEMDFGTNPTHREVGVFTAEFLLPSFFFHLEFSRDQVCKLT